MCRYSQRLVFSHLRVWGFRSWTKFVKVNVCDLGRMLLGSGKEGQLAQKLAL
jgi:hypothetical protein